MGACRGRIDDFIAKIEKLVAGKIETILLINRGVVKWRRPDGGGQYFGDAIDPWLKGRDNNPDVTTEYTPEFQR